MSGTQGWVWGGSEREEGHNKRERKWGKEEVGEKKTKSRMALCGLVD